MSNDPSDNTFEIGGCVAGLLGALLGYYFAFSNAASLANGQDGIAWWVVFLAVWVFLGAIYAFLVSYAIAGLVALVLAAVTRNKS